MGQPFVGEIRIFAGNFPPNGWMFCDGTPLPISENDVLFQLIGTTYGGDGENTFNLPDLRGRLPVHMGTSSFGQTFNIGEGAGTEEVTLTISQIPVHTHPQLCSSGGGTTSSDPANAVPGPADLSEFNNAVAGNVQMGTPPMTSDAAGGSQPHTNFAPYLCVNFIISLFGLFPTPT